MEQAKTLRQLQVATEGALAGLALALVDGMPDHHRQRFADSLSRFSRAQKANGNTIAAAFLAQLAQTIEGISGTPQTRSSDTEH